MDVMVALASSERTLWYVTLAVGLVVALVVAGMLLTLLNLLGRIQAAVTEGMIKEFAQNLAKL